MWWIVISIHSLQQQCSFTVLPLMYFCWNQSVFTPREQPAWTAWTKRAYFARKGSHRDRAVSLHWIITFHAADNGEMWALLCRSVLHSSTLLLNCEQNGSHWLLRFSRGGLCPALWLTFHSPVELERCLPVSVYNEHHKCSAAGGTALRAVN